METWLIGFRLVDLIHRSELASSYSVGGRSTRQLRRRVVLCQRTRPRWSRRLGRRSAPHSDLPAEGLIGGASLASWSSHWPRICAQGGDAGQVWVVEESAQKSLDAAAGAWPTGPRELATAPTLERVDRERPFGRLELTHPSTVMPFRLVCGKHFQPCCRVAGYDGSRRCRVGLLHWTTDRAKRVNPDARRAHHEAPYGKALADLAAVSLVCCGGHRDRRHAADGPNGRFHRSRRDS